MITKQLLLHKKGVDIFIFLEKYIIIKCAIFHTEIDLDFNRSTYLFAKNISGNNKYVLSFYIIKLKFIKFDISLI